MPLSDEQFGFYKTAAGCPRGRPGVLEFPCTATRLANGNTLIVDAGDEIGAGSEVIEVDARGQVVWNYHGGLRFAHSAFPTRAGNVLIADTTNDRVLEVSREGRVVWTTERLDALSDGSRLEYPNNAIELEGGNLLITDRNNDRGLIIDRDGQVLWQYGGSIRHPHNVEMLPDGHFLLADSDGNRVVEIDYEGRVIWEYGDGSPAMLSWPRHARRLPSGNTLIADSKNSRVIEVTPEKSIAWEYKVDYFAKFYYAEKLDNGHVLIADQQGHRVLEVDPAGTLVWQFRNYLYPNPILPRLRNGNLRKKDANGWPEDWILMRRFSEGGGAVIWDDSGRRPAAGLAYDRQGALCLQQTVACTPGVTYHMAGQIRTEGLDGSALFQLSFVDAMGAAIDDAPDIPRGQPFSGDTAWTQDAFQAVAPERATAMDVRLFITGRGRAFAKGILVHA